MNNTEIIYRIKELNSSLPILIPLNDEDIIIGKEVIFKTNIGCYFKTEIIGIDKNKIRLANNDYLVIKQQLFYPCVILNYQLYSELNDRYYKNYFNSIL